MNASFFPDTFRNFFLAAGEPAGDPDRVRLAGILGEDFSTPGALALFHEWRSQGDAASLRFGLEVFGLGKLAAIVAAPPEIVELARQRGSARELRDWSEADRLRLEIEAAGWVVRDIPGEPPGFRLVQSATQ